MIIADMRDYIDGLELMDAVYAAKLPDGTKNAACVYPSQTTQPYERTIGEGTDTHDILYITVLVHGNTSQRETETLARALFQKLRDTRNAVINGETILFILPRYDLQYVSTDEAGVYEYVIEAAVYYDINN